MHWSAATARWTIASTLTLMHLFTFGFLDELLSPRGLEWLHAVCVLVLYVAGAIAYRRINRKVIAHASLVEPLDLLGQPIGHWARVRLFCILLGWAVFYASVSVAHEMREIEPRSAIGWIFVFGPVVLGYGIYKITLWWITPKTTAALPAGGFEVIHGKIRKDDERDVR